MSKVTISNFLYLIAIILVIIYLYLKNQDKDISEVYFVALAAFGIGFTLRQMAKRNKQKENP